MRRNGYQNARFAERAGTCCIDSASTSAAVRLTPMKPLTAARRPFNHSAPNGDSPRRSVVMVVEVADPSDTCVSDDADAVRW